MKHHTLSLLIIATLTGAASAHSWKAGEAPVFDEALRAHLLADWQQQHPEKQSATPQLAANGAAPSISMGKAPAQAAPFVVFAPKVNVKWDADFLYIESNGMPAHGMMVGITAWQQQVPLPQAYYGDNAWRIPLHPVPAKTPAVIEGRFLRGAIALGVNGIPIFNPQNNRGEVSYEIGELDQWGGHCGRADDYHYHIAPLHLQAVVGKGQPIAYALDGYPIYGLTEPDGSPVGKLDECHGHELAGVGYHYHASTKRPYLQSAFHGEVVEAGGQVDPQPRAQGVRPDTPPLRGAEITAFESTGANGYKLSYTVGTDKRAITYAINADGTYPFEFDNGKDGKTKEVYTKREGGGGDGGPPREGGGGKGRGQGRGQGKGGPERAMRNPEPTPAPRSEEGRPAPAATSSLTMDVNGDGLISAQEYAEAAKSHFAKQSRGGNLAEAMAKARATFTALDRNHDGQLDAGELQANAAPATAAATKSAGNGAFSLRSPEVENNGPLPIDYSGDGSGATLPLEWSGAPAGTQSYALIMHHIDPEGVAKWYWTLYDIPANVTSLPKNVKNVGKVGTGFKGEIGYEPPHSKGPGAKTYTLTVYALSAAPKIKAPPSQVNREVLLAAIKDITLASAELNVVYTSRGSSSSAEPERKGPRGEAPAMAKEPSAPSPGASPAAGAGGQRKPWMQMHGAEMDADHDGVITLEEMAADMKRAFALYDQNHDGIITPAEIDAAGDIREGAAFAGFIYRHAVDLDADNDSRITPAETLAVVKYFFDTADQDRDGKVTTAEADASPNAALPVPQSTALNSPAAPQPQPTPPPSGPASSAGNAKGKGKGGGKGGADNKDLIKPSMADTFKVNVYADNWFVLYINGKLTAVDSIDFIPHNVVTVDILPEYPMTIAVMAKDNADPKTGMEYGDHIGDGGFIIKFADGTVSNASWKAKSFFKGPLNHDVKNPQVQHIPIPENWFAIDFDDSQWAQATEYTEERVNPKEPFYNADFTGAKFIWTDDLDLDNTIIFRTKVVKEGWKPRWNTKPDLDVRGAPLK